MSVTTGNSRALVVGASGFIGSHMCRRLASEGFDVHGTFHHNPPALGEAVTMHRLDLRQPGDTGRLLHAIGPDMVFNFAQVSPAKANEPTFMTEVFGREIQGLINLLESCTQTRVKRLVHACSSTVYADVGDEAMSETTALNPNSARGLCKLVERDLCRHYGNRADMTVVLGRIFRAYGPGDRPEKLIQHALTCQEQDQAVGLPAHTSRRDYIHIDDVVNAFSRLATQPLVSGEEINIGSGREHTPDQILDLLEAITQHPIRRRRGGYAPGLLDRSHWRADISKAERLLDWRPQVSLENGMAQTVAWFRRVQSDALTGASGD